VAGLALSFDIFFFAGRAQERAGWSAAGQEHFTDFGAFS